MDMGETSIDEGTFDEYLAEIREHYTADKVCYTDWSPTAAPLTLVFQYHLLGAVIALIFGGS